MLVPLGGSNPEVLHSLRQGVSVKVLGKRGADLFGDLSHVMVVRMAKTDDYFGTGLLEGGCLCVG